MHVEGGDAERFEMRRPRCPVGEACAGMIRGQADGFSRQIALAHVGDRCVISNSHCVAGKRPASVSDLGQTPIYRPRRTSCQSLDAKIRCLTEVRHHGWATRCQNENCCCVIDQMDRAAGIEQFQEFEPALRTGGGEGGELVIAASRVQTAFFALCPAPESSTVIQGAASRPVRRTPRASSRKPSLPSIDSRDLLPRSRWRCRSPPADRAGAE